MNHNFRELQIWQESVENATITYTITKKFPKEELFGIVSQMRRASVSIASNIAEGSGRGTDAQFSHFLDLAIGSSFELETQIIISKNLGYVDTESSVSWIDNLQRLNRKISTLKNRLNK